MAIVWKRFRLDLKSYVRGSLHDFNPSSNVRVEISSLRLSQNSPTYSQHFHSRFLRALKRRTQGTYCALPEGGDLTTDTETTVSISCDFIRLAIYPEKALGPQLLGSSNGQKLAATKTFEVALLIAIIFLRLGKLY